jgi:TetR/AcrR family transcriptional regulator, repressor for neighboring sulfatase
MPRSSAQNPRVNNKAAGAARPRRIRRAASDMRAEALSAARRLIMEGSEDVLTMRAVADAAGVTYPNLSHHFGSAEGLHAAIAEDLVRELLAGLQTLDVEMNSLEHDYRAIVDRVFDLFVENGMGRVIGWLVRSGEKKRLEPMNRMLAEFMEGRAQGSSNPEDAKRISRVALIVAFAAYAESTAGALLGEVLGVSPSARRAYFAQALAALREH